MTDRAPRFVWGHVNVNVSNLERSIDFYRKLGFELFMPGIPYLGLSTEAASNRLPDAGARALGLPAGSRGRACIMQLGDGFPKLDLTELTGPSANVPLGNADVGLVRFCLATPDLKEAYARLRAEGVRFLSEPQPGHGGLADVATCADPDGTLIELLQIHPEKWPARDGKA